jgi:hypothetical protein
MSTQKRPFKDKRMREFNDKNVEDINKTQTEAKKSLDSCS